MIATLRSRTALHAIVLGVMVAVTFVPSALVLYRCRAMATTMLSPCCGREDEPRGSDTAQLRAEDCCSKFTVSLERAPSNLTPRTDGRDLTPPVVAPVSFALVVPPPSLVPHTWTRAQFDAGPPVILLICSLLI